MTTAAADAKTELTAALEALNRESPPDYDPPPFLGNFRHRCASQGNVSKAIDLKEVYVAYDPDPTLVAMIYREGKCKRCGQVARSKVPRFVDPKVRPPAEGRVARA